MALSRITAASIADGTVVAADIADGAITTAKIADGNVTAAKVSTIANTQLTGTITSAQLGTGAVSNTKIASGAVEQYFADTGYETQFRNRIINGDMRIDQRNAGASVNTNAAYPVDRFQYQNDSDATLTLQQSSTAPTGFSNSLSVTVSTADASVGAAQYALITHRIEGYNIADLGWGSASAKTITVSFWVRSSVTGTFGGVLNNIGSARSYPFTYTISVADTWEQKSVTIAGDTSGTWNTTNSIGIVIRWALGVGSTYAGTSGSWSGSTFFGATGGTQLISTLNATWYITGVQLEVGSVATPFERRPYGTELQLCQRYFQTIGAITAIGNNFDSTQAIGVISYPVAMRATPTLSATGAITLTDTGANYTQSSAVFTSSDLDQYAAAVRFNNLTGTTAYRPYFYNYTNSSNRLLTFSAEL